jgi:hypothetical protein
VKLRNAIVAYHVLIGPLLTFPTAVFAQAAPGTAGSSISGSGSAACNALVNSTAVSNANGWMTAIIVILAGTPFKVAAVLGCIIAAIALFLDSGHFGQHIKQILMLMIGIMLVGLFVGFVFGGQVSIASC